jgi:hypothetical protein
MIVEYLKLARIQWIASAVVTKTDGEKISYLKESIENLYNSKIKWYLDKL